MPTWAEEMWAPKNTNTEIRSRVVRTLHYRYNYVLDRSCYEAINIYGVEIVYFGMNKINVLAVHARPPCPPSLSAAMLSSMYDTCLLSFRKKKFNFWKSPISCGMMEISNI